MVVASSSRVVARTRGVVLGAELVGVGDEGADGVQGAGGVDPSVLPALVVRPRFVGGEAGASLPWGAPSFWGDGGVKVRWRAVASRPQAGQGP